MPAKGFIKLMQEEAIKKARDIHGDKYEYGEFKGSHEYWDIYCKKCKEWFKQTYTNHIDSKQGCKYCGYKITGIKLSYTSDYFIKLASKKTNSHIVVKKEDYKGWKIPMKAICNHPEHPHGEITIIPNIHINLNTQCEKCYHIKNGKLSRDKAAKNFIAYIKKHHPEGKTLNFSRWEYGKDNKEKGWIGCDICNEWWEVSAHSLKSGRGCPYHKKSKGEQEAKRILKKLKRKYESQKWFDDCRNPLTGKVLYFDVCDVKTGGLVEYDGEGHFRPVKFDGMSMKRAIEVFKKGKKRDREKTRYCKKNNIPLLRIPYWDYKKMERLIKDFLNIK